MHRTLVAVLCVFLSIVPVAARELSFEDRVRAQEAIERVYYAHQIGATKPFEQAVPRALIERKVSTSLRLSLALERFWRTDVRREALQRELARIERATRFPDRLRQIRAALGNDRQLLQEVLARSVLVERLARRFHEADVQSGKLVEAEWERFWARVESQFDPAQAPTVASDDGPPEIESLECLPDDSWDPPEFTTTPSDREEFSMIWTGTEAIVWGGRSAASGSALNDGRRYDPLVDAWRSVSSTGAPSPRERHTAVWTGTSMLVWGGVNGSTALADGSRYDPVSDAWSPISSTQAPAGRASHTAVWTGSKLLVWGGSSAGVPRNDGGSYDPSTDTWAPISPLGSPGTRERHVAVWTGSRMLVWGGAGALDGGSYDPASDTWTPLATSSAPPSAGDSTAVWTGSRMIVWGGRTLDGSARCAPSPHGIVDRERDVHLGRVRRRIVREQRCRTRDGRALRSGDGCVAKRSLLGRTQAAEPEVDVDGEPRARLAGRRRALRPLVRPLDSDSVLERVQQLQRGGGLDGNRRRLLGWLLLTVEHRCPVRPASRALDTDVDGGCPRASNGPYGHLDRE